MAVDYILLFEGHFEDLINQQLEKGQSIPGAEFLFDSVWYLGRTL